MLEINLLKVTIHNISDTDRTLKMVVNTNTDEVQDGKFTLRPQLTEQSGLK